MGLGGELIQLHRVIRGQFAFFLGETAESAQPSASFRRGRVTEILAQWMLFYFWDVHAGDGGENYSIMWAMGG